MRLRAHQIILPLSAVSGPLLYAFGISSSTPTFRGQAARLPAAGRGETCSEPTTCGEETERVSLHTIHLCVA